jgi:hypothetical protein
MKKLRSELYSKDEFIKYYNGAGKRELKQALKNAKGNTKIQRNEQDAIKALLM